MNVEQLKNSILQLAIQGKLVEQREEEGTAEELYQQIQLEKNQSIKEGKVKKSKPLPPIDLDQVPFEIPATWKWVLLGDLFSNQSGLTYNKSNLDTIEKDMVRVLRGGNISEMSYEFKNDDVFIGKSYVNDSLLLKKNTLITPAVTSLTHIGKLVRIDSDYNDVVVGGFVLMLQPYSNSDLLSKFLEYSMNSDYVRNFLRDSTNKSGQAFYNLSRTAMNESKIPLPPFPEQQRIVDKIEELMPLIEEYGESYVKLEELNKRFPQDIKQSILQYAIQGKLVEQREEEGTAEELYQQIQLEKNKLIKEGKLNNLKPLNPINQDEVPFDIPSSWKWIRLGLYSEKITDFVASGSFKSLRENCPTLKYKDYALLVKTADFNNGFKNNLSYTSRSGYDFLSNSNLFGGELILSNIGSIGKIFIVPKLDIPMTLAPNSIMIKLTSENFIPYLYHFMKSDFFYKQLIAISSGTTIKKFNKTQLKSLLLAIPPLKEQQRIVDKIEELMSITKALEGDIL